jgi:hypothetical protein
MWWLMRLSRVLPEKWEPVFRKEARKNKELGSGRDSTKTGQILEWEPDDHWFFAVQYAGVDPFHDEICNVGARNDAIAPFAWA